MTDQGRRVVCVYGIPVSVEDVRRAMRSAPIKDAFDTPMGTTEGMEGALPTATFGVTMRDGSRQKVEYPSASTVPEDYVVAVMVDRLQPYQDEHLDALSSRGVLIEPAHPSVIRERPVELLIPFAGFDHSPELANILKP
ncbi:MAG TPA: hypothetical protein VK356_14240 [Thermomicrobiales bacterium]|nr:hypothetical protein [Thermomicrobiales bacterium]